MDHELQAKLSFIVDICSKKAEELFGTFTQRSIKMRHVNWLNLANHENPHKNSISL